MLLPADAEAEWHRAGRASDWPAPRFILVVAQRFIDERAYGLCRKGSFLARKLNQGVIVWRMNDEGVTKAFENAFRHSTILMSFRQLACPLGH
jgi:hypothetical protein